MSIQPVHEKDARIDAQFIDRITQLVRTLTPSQLAWLGGYCTGLNAQSGATEPPAGAEGGDSPEDTLTILYGSQTGNARSVAEELNETAKAEGLAVELVSMGKFKGKELKNLKYLCVAISTQGEGEPPDDAIDLVEYIQSAKAPKMEHLHFCVLALGDSTYEFYCKTGRDFDTRLEELGAQRIIDRVDLDVDFDDGAEMWISKAVKSIKEIIPKRADPIAAPLQVISNSSVHYNRKKPLETRLLTCQKITGRYSEKDVRHVEIDLAGSGMTYLPGDSLGVWFKNDGALVDELLRLLEIDPAETVLVNEKSAAIRDALIETYELTLLHPAFITGYAALTKHEGLAKITSKTEAVREYIATRQVIDVVHEYPRAVEACAFIGLLRKLTPRLYSIASSQSEVEEEVHLTCSVVEYEAQGYHHFGGASGYIGHRLKENEHVMVYVDPNENFRLPPDDTKPIIMIGPGTGIAPFRAFIQERTARQATGENWLFFGNPYFTEDFLYQTEWQEFLRSGALHRIDLAFSRDQEYKIYVQHRIAEKASDIWNWIERGAYIYICGDEKHMAHDVHRALLEVIKNQGGHTEEEAEEFLVHLRQERRYQKDVY